MSSVHLGSINASCRISIDVAYVMSYLLNEDAQDSEIDRRKIEFFFNDKSFPPCVSRRGNNFSLHKKYALAFSF